MVEAISAGLTLGIIILLYFLPTIISSAKKHPHNNAISLVNLFLGWTLVGWIVCLAWAYLETKPVPLVDKRSLPTVGAVADEGAAAEDWINFLSFIKLGFSANQSLKRRNKSFWRQIKMSASFGCRSNQRPSK
ncbi:MAG: superinfection immunity protein [Gammaproteobacteria bacterium]